MISTWWMNTIKVKRTQENLAWNSEEQFDKEIINKDINTDLFFWWNERWYKIINEIWNADKSFPPMVKGRALSV